MEKKPNTLFICFCVFQDGNTLKTYIKGIPVPNIMKPNSSQRKQEECGYRKSPRTENEKRRPITTAKIRGLVSLMCTSLQRQSNPASVGITLYDRCSKKVSLEILIPMGITQTGRVWLENFVWRGRILEKCDNNKPAHILGPN